MTATRSVIAVEDFVDFDGFRSRLAIEGQDLATPGTPAFQRLFDLEVAIVAPDGLMFVNRRLGEVDPVPSLVVGNDIHVFRDTCHDIIRALNQQGLFLGYDSSDVVVQLPGGHILQLRTGGGVDIPAPCDEGGEGDWYFQYAIVLAEPVGTRLSQTVPASLYPPRRAT